MGLKKLRCRMSSLMVFSLLLGAFLPARSLTAVPEVENADELEIALKEMAAWDVDAGIVSRFTRGVYAATGMGPQGGVKYPALKSRTPLYGFVGLAKDSRCLVLDHSEGREGQYDLLYFDADGDRDLSDDGPKRPRTEVPEALASREQVFFESVEVFFDFGPAGRQAVELMPRLWVYKTRPSRMTFVPVVAHTGQFDVEGVSYTAFLGYRYSVEGRLDQPSSALFLAPAGGAPARWWGGDGLGAVHRLGDHLYQFSCTPTGDKLFVRRYTGQTGTLEMGPGGRDVDTVEITGSLRGKDTAVAVGDGLKDGWPQPTRKCEIPVGDYYPAIVTVRMGNVRISVSNNYHVDAQGRSREDREEVYGIKIRADKPYVWDFSNKPVVAFVRPAKNERVSPGDEVKVEAVLLDPALDIMVRRLYGVPNGQDLAAGRPVSLDPKVTVARANGEIVGEGVMPFG